MTNKTENERCCGNCRFFYEDGKQCRRFPPQILTDSDSDYTGASYSAFPYMNKEEWCGEHQFPSSAKAFVEVMYG